MVAWIVGCSLLAGLGATFRTPWWVGPVVGAAYLVSGVLASLSQRLGGDLPARVLLRATFVLGSAALGLAVQALREPRLTPRDFFLSYAPDATTGALWTTVGVLVATSALVLVLLPQKHVGITRP